jgi:hypothetical protein
MTMLTWIKLKLNKRKERIMGNKKNQSQQTMQPGTSRRTFLKTGAAVAGATLAGAAVKASSASAATQTMPALHW